MESKNQRKKRKSSDDYQKALAKLKPEKREWKHGQPKLTGRMRYALCEFLAMGMSPSLAAQELEIDYGVKIHRQTVYENYLKRPKWRKIIKLIREKRFKGVEDHPLFNPRVRLGYILKALNHCLKFYTDKLYLHEGDIVAKLEKVNHGALAPLLKEARESIIAIKGGEEDPTETKITLQQIITNVINNGNGNGKQVDTGTSRVSGDLPVESDALDGSGFRHLQVVRRPGADT